jgi:hypothetical protein
VQALDFPDISGYDATLSGIKAFEMDLLGDTSDVTEDAGRRGQRGQATDASPQTSLL